MSSHAAFGNVPISAAAVALVLAPSFAASQGWIEESACTANTPSEFHVCALEAAASFEPPRTASGAPDLSGDWMLPGGQTSGAYEDLEEHAGDLDALGGAAAIVDPSDGVLPIMPWAVERSEANATGFVHHNAACFLAGVPNTMYHGGPRQFLQTDDVLIITTYNSHGWRVIHLDGRPQLDDKIRLWNGDSRGYWDGNTLVVETTNQNARPWLDQRGRFYTEDAQVVERFTLVDENTMHYEATIEDPNVYTQPFTIVQPYRRINAVPYEMPELACYENNEELMQIYRDVGLQIYPGITPEQAQESAALE